MQIVSLLPSTTEIVFAIGAGDELAGVTVECDYPAEARTRRTVSRSTLPAGLPAREIDELVRARLAAGEDLYVLDEDAIRDIDPDLLLTQDLCAVCAVDTADVDDAMRRLGCTGRVLTIDPHSLDDVLESIRTVGAATGRSGPADELVTSLRSRLAVVAAAVAPAVAERGRPRTVLLEWTDPPFGPGHWVPDLVRAAGGEPVVGRPGLPSVDTDWATIRAADPQVVVVAPCGYHLDDATALAQRVVASGELPPQVPVWAIDADAVIVRPGPRLVDGVEALAGILHPAATPGRPELTALVRG